MDNKGNRAYVWKCLFVALFTIMFLDVNPQRKNKKLFLHSKMMIEGMRKEEFRIDGNARRIIIKHEGKTPLEFPLTIGVAGVTALAIFAPVLVAIGAIAGIITKCTFIVEKNR